MSRTVPFALLAASTLALAACAGSATDDAPVAIATTTPLGSVVGDIAACAGGTSETLMGPGDDPHTFSASSAQVAAMTRADLVITHLRSWCLKSPPPTAARHPLGRPKVERTAVSMMLITILN